MHMKRMHMSEEKPFECNVCNKQFKSAMGIREHNEREHSSSGKKTYECSECGKSFSQSRTLKAHMISFHDDANEHEVINCEFCG